MIGGPYKNPDNWLTPPATGGTWSDNIASTSTTAMDAGRLMDEYRRLQEVYAMQAAYPQATVQLPRWQGDLTRMHSANGKDGETDLVKMLAMRLRWPDGQSLPLDYLGARKSGEKVFLFVVVNNEPVQLEDEWGLFPSDQLVTTLRLLEQKK